jgi:ABC-type Fe3+/spermidine/putrescine transport system ATPase subunit
LAGRAIDGRTVELPGGQRIEVRLREPLVSGAPVRLLIRPERVELGVSGANALPAHVASVMFLGDHADIRLELQGGLRLRATVRGTVVLEPGDRVTVTLPADALMKATSPPPH